MHASTSSQIATGTGRDARPAVEFAPTRLRNPPTNDFFLVDDRLSDVDTPTSKTFAAAVAWI